MNDHLRQTRPAQIPALRMHLLGRPTPHSLGIDGGVGGIDASVTPPDLPAYQAIPNFFSLSDERERSGDNCPASPPQVLLGVRSFTELVRNIEQGGMGTSQSLIYYNTHPMAVFDWDRFERTEGVCIDRWLRQTQAPSSPLRRELSDIAAQMRLVSTDGVIHSSDFIRYFSRTQEDHSFDPNHEGMRTIGAARLALSVFETLGVMTSLPDSHFPDQISEEQILDIWQVMHFLAHHPEYRSVAISLPFSISDFRNHPAPHQIPSTPEESSQPLLIQKLLAYRRRENVVWNVSEREALAGLTRYSWRQSQQVLETLNQYVFGWQAMGFTDRPVMLYGVTLQGFPASDVNVPKLIVRMVTGRLNPHEEALVQHLLHQQTYAHTGNIREESNSPFTAYEVSLLMHYLKKAEQHEERVFGLRVVSEWNDDQSGRYHQIMRRQLPALDIVAVDNTRIQAVHKRQQAYMPPPSVDDLIKVQQAPLTDLQQRLLPEERRLSDFLIVSDLRERIFEGRLYRHEAHLFRQWLYHHMREDGIFPEQTPLSRAVHQTLNMGRGFFTIENGVRLATGVTYHHLVNAWLTRPDSLDEIITRNCGETANRQVIQTAFVLQQLMSQNQMTRAPWSVTAIHWGLRYAQNVALMGIVFPEKDERVSQGLNWMLDPNRDLESDLPAHVLTDLPIIYGLERFNMMWFDRSPAAQIERFLIMNPVGRSLCQGEDLVTAPAEVSSPQETRRSNSSMNVSADLPAHLIDASDIITVGWAVYFSQARRYMAHAIQAAGRRIILPRATSMIPRVLQTMAGGLELVTHGLIFAPCDENGHILGRRPDVPSA